MVILYDIQFVALTVRLPQLIVTGQIAAVKPTTTHVIVSRLVGFVEEHVTPTLGPDAPRGRDVVHQPLTKRSTSVIVVGCSMCLIVHSLETGLHTNNLSRMIPNSDIGHDTTCWRQRGRGCQIQILPDRRGRHTVLLRITVTSATPVC